MEIAEFLTPQKQRRFVDALPCDVGVSTRRGGKAVQRQADDKRLRRSPGDVYFLATNRIESSLRPKERIDSAELEYFEDTTRSVKRQIPNAASSNTLSGVITHKPSSR
jgi:hypothetical protein